MRNDKLFSESNEATYSPEDNKLRLYVGRVPKPEYLALRAEGWISTPKQGCDFVSTWTPQRRDTCLSYAGIILDEDQGPEDRAADRAERFTGYLGKRLDEATGHADRYEAGPAVHGYQSQARAERSAARHDRIGDRAVDAWSKAEYWQRRTRGVISHALYKSRPDVRMGRIKTLEAELRKERKDIEERKALYARWKKIEAIQDPEKQTEAAAYLAGHVHMYGNYKHPRADQFVGENHGIKYYRENAHSLYSLLTHDSFPELRITGAEACAIFFDDHSEPGEETEWTIHLTLRLGYENQMLEEQGGRAAFVEMQVGGWIGDYQIRKVNKSVETGRVVSVSVMDPAGWSGYTRASGYKNYETRAAVVVIKTERLRVEAYRPPGPGDLEKLEATIKAEKEAAPKKAECPLINPTKADADRLQALWNERARVLHAKARAEYRTVNDFIPSSVCECPQEVYSKSAGGTYSSTETRKLCRNGELTDRQSNMYCRETEERAKRIGSPVCKIRITGAKVSNWWTPDRVVVLIDKPQKPFPAEVWEGATTKKATLPPAAQKEMFA